MMEISLKLQRELWYIKRPSSCSTLPWSSFSLLENVTRYLFPGCQLSTLMEESWNWNWWNNQTAIYQIRYIEVARYLKHLIVKSKTTTLQVWKALFKTDFIVQKKKMLKSRTTTISMLRINSIYIAIYSLKNSNKHRLPQAFFQPLLFFAITCNNIFLAIKSKLWSN